MEPGEVMAVEPLVLDLLRQGMPVELEVSGRSMGPFIETGDVIQVAPIGGCEARVGDVVLCGLGSHRFVVHRVLAVDEGRVCLRGDALFAEDGWLPMDRVAGKVTAVRRAGRPRRCGLGWRGRPLALLSRWGVLAHLLTVRRGLRRLAGRARR